MSASSGLAARLVRRVHAGLMLDLELGVADECVVLFGPSGAGKTSILRMIAGFDRPDAGSVRLDGRMLFDSSRGIREPLRRRGIGYVDQHHQLFPHLDVAGNVRFGLVGWGREDSDRRLAEISRLCDVSRLLDRRISTLSGGERQRVALARALAPRPRLLLCDEPFASLDLPARSSLASRLRNVRDADHLPTLFVTHSPAEAVTVGDRVLVLEGGSVVEEGLPLDVLGSRWPTGGPTLDLMNALPGVVVGETPDHLASVVRLDGGPDLVVPRDERATGTPVLVLVPAAEVIIAATTVAAAGLSARNGLEAVVDRVVSHGDEAEVVARTGSLCWIVSVVAGAVSSLGLVPGKPCVLVLKARSCRVVDRGVAAAGT